MKTKSLNWSKSSKLIFKNLFITFFITLTLAFINCTDMSKFLFFWMRSWIVAGLIANFFSFVFLDE